MHLQEAHTNSHFAQLVCSIVQAHEERCTDLAWHPQALCADPDTGEARSPEALCYATASADSSAKLWNMAGTCLHTCTGHTRRLARLMFHPQGAHESSDLGLCVCSSYQHRDGHQHGF